MADPEPIRQLNRALQVLQSSFEPISEMGLDA